MITALSFALALSACAETVVVKAAPAPVSLTAQAAKAPGAVPLAAGEKAPYSGVFFHEDRLAVIVWKAEAYDRAATEGVAVLRPKFGWKDWALLVAIALAAGGAGTWTGGRAK